MKENKLDILLWVIFVIVGAIFCLIGIALCGNIFNYENKIETTGTIAEIVTHTDNNNDDVEHDVYVSYTVAGKKYRSKLNGYSFDFYEGKEIKIYYDKDNPNKIGMKSLDKLFLLFPGFGMIFFIGGVVGIFVNIKKVQDEKFLKENGDLIYADYVRTDLNTTYMVNGRNPYNIICEWNSPLNGEKYKFKSKNIWKNPERIIEEKNIKQFPVYINSQDLSKYAVDIDVLKEEQ